MIGTIISKYKIDTLLGTGTVGDIFTGTNTETKQKVTIRRIDRQLINSNIEIKLRIKNDLYLLSQISHPGIAQVYEYVTWGDDLYCISEFIEGTPINRYLEKATAGRREYVSMLDGLLMPKILDALQAVHSKGVSHGHLRPANIVVTKEGQPKIINFGFADLSEIDKSAKNAGIIEYLSPEQIQKRPVDTRSDIYSLGIILYELISGKKPYAGISAEGDIAAKIAGGPFQIAEDSIEGLPEKYIVLIKKATEFYPENRINISQFKSEFGAATDITTVYNKPAKQTVYQKPPVTQPVAPPPPPPPAPPKPSQPPQTPGQQQPPSVKKVEYKVPQGIYVADKNKGSGKKITAFIVAFIFIMGYVLIRNMVQKNSSISNVQDNQAYIDSVEQAIKQMQLPASIDSSKLNQPVQSAGDTIYSDAEELPQFPDGQKGLERWLKSNVKYPNAARQQGITGEVVVSFVIEANGRVSNVKIVKDIGAGCGDEAIRAVNQMPGWKPGKQNGKNVRLKYTLPIKFSLE